jgi:hypothetical protein
MNSEANRDSQHVPDLTLAEKAGGKAHEGTNFSSSTSLEGESQRQ